MAAALPHPSFPSKPKRPTPFLVPIQPETHVCRPPPCVTPLSLYTRPFSLHRRPIKPSPVSSASLTP
ncbi:hypothetical protein E2C01_032393 [Portunus trituberculatus]|uniref:Uncharacterized protein n=1 Tax=Portunus trituberculatus TaxID=210409 RepID=A0A5B7F060_PORTR|nr:hypothetical protein [Portunus trituberculatus]